MQAYELRKKLLNEIYKMRKNIGIDGRLWYESGVGRYIRNLVLGLDNLKTDHEFTIFLNTKAFNEVEFNNKNFRKVKADIPWHTLREQINFKRILDRENLDLMHFTYLSYPILYKKPFIVTIHDLIIDHFPTGNSSSLPLPFYKLKRLAYKKITRNSVKNAEKIIVPSNATKDELINLYHAKLDKISVINEGFDSLISNSKSKGDLVSNNYILYVGNAFPHKNLKTLIKAFKKIRQNREVDLVLIGKKDYFYETLEENPFPGIYFLHNIEDSKLFEYYRNAHCLVMPTLMEGFGLPLLEAMSLSCPVVSSNTPALKEIGGKACLYFDPKDDNDVKEKIEKIIDNKEIRENLVKNGLIESKRFSWENCAKDTLKLYESCDSLRSG